MNYHLNLHVLVENLHLRLLITFKGYYHKVWVLNVQITQEKTNIKPYVEVMALFHQEAKILLDLSMIFLQIFQ